MWSIPQLRHCGVEKVPTTSFIFSRERPRLTVNMLLGQISYLDCSAFLAFLAPQLLLQAGLVDTIKCAFQTLPFICISDLPTLCKHETNQNSIPHAI